jgi:hypothetical protein
MARAEVRVAVVGQTMRKSGMTTDGHAYGTTESNEVATMATVHLKQLSERCAVLRAPVMVR